MTKWSAFLIVSSLLITAHRLPAPIREIEETPKPAAPTKAKAESKSPGKPTTQNGMQSHSVTVVLTENTRAAILYLKNYVQTYESMPFAGKSDVHPDEIFEQLRQALSTRFSNVSIPNGSSPSRSGGLTMVFDLQAHVGSVSFTANTVSFIATFKNSAGRQIQTIAASGKSTIPYPAFGTQFPKAVSRAFADFSQKLNATR
ncbi:MAG TPA: hypothetical protein VN827_03470 [Chthoniobacterales bacterium]|nr:hypothetical protein [Chthoniobacterales bacterium]